MWRLIILVARLNISSTNLCWHVDRIKGHFQTWLSALTSRRCGRIASRLFSINSSALMFMELSRTGQRPRRAATEDMETRCQMLNINTGMLQLR